MFWDIVIVAGIALSQLFVTIYAVWVSVTEHKIKIAFVIALVGAMGIALTVWAAIRSDRAQQALQAQLNRIQQNTEKPTLPPVVNVNPPAITFPAQRRHTALNFLPPQVSNANNGPLLPFHKDEKVALNLGTANAGDFAIRDSVMDGMVTLADLPNLNSVFKQNRSKLKPESHSGAINAHAGGIAYRTYIGTALTDDDVIQLNGQKKAVCLVGVSDWEDESGKYETGACNCFVVGDSDWHSCEDNNKERKLR